MLYHGERTQWTYLTIMIWERDNKALNKSVDDVVRRRLINAKPRPAPAQVDHPINDPKLLVY